MSATKRLQVGLLPCYLKLYDDVLPGLRAGFDGFLEKLAAGLEARGMAVQRAPVCRVAAEFEGAVQQLAQAGVEALMTVHLAYSPSLEVIEAACRTDLPLILLDTTMDADFGLGVSPERLMYDHGVHGVMDFASMLRQRGRVFEIVAGHVDDPTVLETAADLARAAHAARELHGGRVLRVGETFAGMGDFAVEETVLADRFGIQVRQIGVGVLDAAVETISKGEVAREVADDRDRFVCELAPEAHARSVRVGLGLRRLLEEGAYQAMSVNFQAFDRADRPANTMPFLEISKAMARGVGYAGEGDVLTSALVGALARGFGAVTFTEIFCPDWAGNSLFLSHMGEISPAVAGEVPRLIAKPFFAGGSLDPALLTCAVQPGPAVLVNLAPGPEDSFSLILAPVEVLAEDASLDPAMRDMVRAWVRPRMPIARFLEEYSRAGGTHHSALVLGERVEALAAFGRWSGLEVVRLGS
jgi:L-arabinose isomerase